MAAKSGNRSIQKPIVLAPGQTSIVTGASASDVVISKPFVLLDGLSLRVDVRHTAVTGTCTLKLQVSAGPDIDIDGVLLWTDAKTSTLTVGAGVAYSSLTLLPQVAADQQYLPLPQVARIVLSTAAASGCTISKINVLS